MGLEYLHFVAPRALTWSPPADIAFDLDRSLRRMGLARGDATVYDPTLRVKGLPKKRGKLGPRVELGGELLVKWEPTEEGAHTAGFLFGDADYDEGLFCEVSYQSGPAYKVAPPTRSRRASTGASSSSRTPIASGRRRASTCAAAT